MFENARRGRQARTFTTKVSKILDLKSSSEQIFLRKLSLGAPDILKQLFTSVSMSSIGYLPRRFRGIGKLKYPILATSTSMNNCYLLLSLEA